MNGLKEEFYLAIDEKKLIINGIKKGLRRFYQEREGKPLIVTEKNFISRQRASYVFDAIYHLAHQQNNPSITAEIRNAGLNYEYVLLILEERNVIVTFSQVKNREDLPEHSEYRSEYTEGNVRLNPQLSFFEELGSLHLKKYKHLIVTYNGANGKEPEFIWIGATNRSQNLWIYHEDLLG